MVKLEKQKSDRFFLTAYFLVHALMEDPFCSGFYLEDKPKGICSNFFYITDVTKCQDVKNHRI